MKNFKTLLLSALLLPFGNAAQAQDDAPGTKSPTRVTVDIDGVSLSSKTKEERKNAKFLVTYGMVDLGFNRISDKTNYSSGSNSLSELYTMPSGVVPSSAPFKLNEGKSINVNVWIANTRLRLVDGDQQKLYFTSGIGLQMYNFRFDSRVMYKSDPNTHLETIPADVDIQKNKLGFTYAAIPVGLLAKTRISEKRWLVYGASVTGGYRIASWTKLKTAQDGKEKNHDPFNFSDFNACVMAEVGIDDVIRFYGSYQLTPLSSGPLNQHPFAIGIRFFGL